MFHCNAFHSREWVVGASPLWGPTSDFTRQSLVVPSKWHMAHDTTRFQYNNHQQASDVSGYYDMTKSLASIPTTTSQQYHPQPSMATVPSELSILLLGEKAQRKSEEEERERERAQQTKGVWWHALRVAVWAPPLLTHTQSAVLVCRTAVFTCKLAGSNPQYHPTSHR